MSARFGFVLLALTALACSTESQDDGTSTPSSVEDVGAYAATLDKAVTEGLTGVIAAVRTPEGAFDGARGIANKATNQEIRTDQLFRIASNSKSFLGVVAAKLHVAGVIDLNAGVADLLPADMVAHVANLDKVTLRQLLQHESGIDDYLAFDAYFDRVLDGNGEPWTPEQAIAIVYDQPARFEPGAELEYSNTNYLLAGLAIDKALGHHHSAEIRKRILEPLGMSHTYYEGHEQPAGDIVHGYEELDGKELDAFDLQDGRGLADGGMVSTAADIATYIAAVGHGDALLTPAEREELIGSKSRMLDGGERYGLGISVNEGAHGPVVRHGGSVIGYQSDMLHFPDSGITVVAFANRGGQSMEGPWSALFDDLEELAFAEVGASAATAAE